MTNSQNKQSSTYEFDGRFQIITWNIHDSSDSILGTKTTRKSFLNNINQGDIFCLQETKESLKIPGYTCYNSLRSDSRSGGLCLGVRHELLRHVKKLATKKFSPDIQAVVLSRHLTNLSKDTLLVNIYDSPDNSSYKVKKRAGGTYEETLETLNDFLVIHGKDRLLLLCGDFNARIGSENSIASKDSELLDELANGSFSVNSHPTTERTRNSKDICLNARGKKLMNLAASHNLKILNGAIIGDSSGEYTCATYNGLSVVDYFLSSFDLVPIISSMKIKEFTEISDHRPVLCSFIAPIPSHLYFSVSSRNFKECSLGYTWKANSDESKEKFSAYQANTAIQARIEGIRRKPCTNVQDVYDLNDSLVSVMDDIASNTLEKKRSGKRKSFNKNVWYDLECRKEKRRTNKLGKRYCKYPSIANRDTYFRQKKTYRRLLKKKKSSFFAKLSRQIMDEKSINWKEFNKIRSYNKKPNSMDLNDLGNFYKFFKELYSAKTLPDEIVHSFKRECTSSAATNNENVNNLSADLNGEITLSELSACIKKLKNRKAVAEDGIMNEFLKNADPRLCQAIIKVFNECLSVGVYPWNVSLITPLHKKGDKYDPNNYRAIAVGSNLGKLFASILLDRLIKFRNDNCPDPINQLGFCKGGQTCDHIFAMNTCIQKYLRRKEHLYSCFIDYQKAFDTVCREALLYKLHKLGIQGRFFNCLSHMYTNSKARIKLLDKVSDTIDVLIGTEQGHPMSPELFKCYLLELTESLDNTPNVSSPELGTKRVTHLLWADDLVLLALDRKSLQNLIDTVNAYCITWGLTVNLDKTAVLVFNKTGRQLKSSIGLVYGRNKITSAKQYCYLGITFSLSGSMKRAQNDLRLKGLRAYFSLRSMVDIRSLNTKSLFRLFDALIVPVFTYGCPVWIHETNYTKLLVSKTLFYNYRTSIDKIAADHTEQIHLKFLKWSLGLSPRASNMVCWGDTGRLPIVVQVIKQVFGYINRLEAMSLRQDCDNLVKNAYTEQKQLALPWYKCTKELKTAFQSRHGSLNPASSKKSMEETFRCLWRCALKDYSKLSFYRVIKDDISFEPYLDISNYYGKKNIAKLRSSNHRLNCETGRYIPSRSSSNYTIVKDQGVWRKCCRVCCDEEAETLSHLPFYEPIIEDEQHVIATCPSYHHIRLQLNNKLKEAVVSWDKQKLKELFNEENVDNFSKYIQKIFSIRFPKTQELH